MTPYALKANKARAKVGHAVKSGRLVKMPCIDCGETTVQAHHPRGYDDAHALDVEWLCRADHLARHQKRHRASWERPGHVRAYMAKTGRVWTPEGGWGRTYNFSTFSGPAFLFRTVERVWACLRTDEERAAFVELVERLTSANQGEAVA